MNETVLNLSDVGLTLTPGNAGAVDILRHRPDCPEGRDFGAGWPLWFKENLRY